MECTSIERTRRRVGSEESFMRSQLSAWLPGVVATVAIFGVSEADASTPPESSATETGGFAARYAGETDSPLAYYEYLPPSYGNGEPSPLLVFLHGLDASGDGSEAELGSVLADGIPNLLETGQWPSERPFVVLAPQHAWPADEELYAPCFEGPYPGDCALPIQAEQGHPEDNSLCHTPAAVHAFIEYALDTYDVDADRVYLTGLSCGGFATFEYIADYGATQIAAAVPIAGEGRLAWERVQCNLGTVPIWAFHGDDDVEVNPAGSITTMTNLASCPSAAENQLTIYPGVDHNSWTRTYDLSAGHDIYAWLLEHERPHP